MYKNPTAIKILLPLRIAHESDMDNNYSVLYNYTEE